MKKTVILIILTLALSNICKAQYWAPNGTSWYYEQDDFDFQLYSFIKFESIGDTLILGDSVKIIQESEIYKDTASQNIYLKYEDNKVYYFNPADEKFKQLYDFNAVKGDTLIVFCRQSALSEEPYVSIKIDSLSTKIISDDTLKVQYFSQINGGTCFMDNEYPIIERIGHTKFMFPQHAIADPPYGGPLRCYQDPMIGLFKTVDFECDYVTSNDKKILNHKDIKILPNPVENKIIIKSSHSITRIELYSIYGNLIKRTINETTMDISEIPNGNYFLRIVLKDKKSLIKKIVKIVKYNH